MFHGVLGVACVVRFSNEKIGGRIFTQSMEQFSEFIRDNKLIDLLLVGSTLGPIIILEWL